MGYGRAGDFRVEHISAGAGTIDQPINRWIADNPNVDVIDIKFSSSATCESWGTDALIIYRHKK